MSSPTHEEKLARAKELLGERYLLHPANLVARKHLPKRRFNSDWEGRTPLDDELDDPRRGLAAEMNKLR